MGVLDTGYGNMPYGLGEYGDGTIADPVLPEGWGTEEWGLDCWGGVCPNSIWFWGWDPLCDAVNASRGSSVSFGVKTSDPIDSIDLASVVITITVDDIIYKPSCGEYEGWAFNGVVYTGGAFVAPWTGTVTPDGNGFTFEIIPPQAWPPNAQVCITVYVESAAGEEAEVECCWTVEDVFCITVEIISLTKLLVRFSDKMKYSGSGVSTVTNWEIIPVESGFVNNQTNEVNIISAVPDGASRNPDFVLLNTTKMVPNQRYKVKCRNLVDIYNRTVGDWVTFLMRRTKVDSVLEGLPSMWNVSGTSNFFWVFASISKQDEKLGGTIDDVDI